MKDYKRALRRWKSKCKYEKRLEMWARLESGSYPFVGKFDFEVNDNGGYQKIKGNRVEDLKNKARTGEFWTFLKWTSTPCSCWMCAYKKYDRTPKYKIKKQTWDDIQDDLAS